MRVGLLSCYAIIIALFIMFIMALMPPSCTQDLFGDGDSGGTGDGVVDDGNGDGDIGVNVTEGKVKINIINPEGASIVGEVLDFVSESEGASVLFAPGSYYFTEGFKIKNEGDVKVTYCMYITREEGEDMKEFEAAFDFFITTDNENYNSEDKLKDFTGILEPDESSEVYYLVVKMRSDAGNDYQGRDFDGIGITVNATQVQTEG